LQSNKFLDIETTLHGAKVLNTLLNDFNTYSESRRKQIVGAARYFVNSNDADPDTLSMLDLNDDVAVLNYDLEIISKPQLKMEL
jgi:uncharacterized membrane protein YkvA (DUF1232 family)